MLVYNNKLLMVGGKAIKYIPPRNLSISLKIASSSNPPYAWSRNSTSQDDWPSDFGSALWKCSSDGQFWSGGESGYFFRSIIEVGSFDETLASYIFPAFFQLAYTTRLGWFARTTNRSCSMAAGTSGKSSTFNTQLSDKIFDHKVGTFNPDRTTYFGWIAWNTSNLDSVFNWGYCRTPMVREYVYEPTLTLLEQK